MTGNGKDTTGELLNLRSRMSELAQVPPWIERLAERHTIPATTQFAMDLCLEEVLSNIIRHGYSNKPDHPIVVQFTSPTEEYFMFVVEDEEIRATSREHGVLDLITRTSTEVLRRRMVVNQSGE